jgi:NAD(P)-dependent dehydrogenase (short-subunit alcohol dehydrogenase family)
VVADIDAANGASSSELIGLTVTFVPLDLRSGDGLSAIVAAAVDRFGGLHVLINSAGGRGGTSPRASGGAMLELNLTSAMRAPASAGQACERCSRAAYLHGAKMAEADLVGVDLTKAYLAEAT